APNAVNATVLAQTNDELDGLAYGAVSGSGNYLATKAFTLNNTSGSSVTYNLSASANAGFFSFPSSVTVPAHGSKNVLVTLSISASTFASLPTDDTFFAGTASVGQVTSVRGTIV